MGEELKSSPLENKKTIKEMFEELCPYFMAIGMTYDEFWNKDPQLAKYFLKADEIRQKRENEHLWLQGYYNYIAFAYVSPIFNPFAKRGTKAVPYPSQPLALSREEMDRREEKARQGRLQNLKQKLLASVKKSEEVKE